MSSKKSMTPPPSTTMSPSSSSSSVFSGKALMKGAGLAGLNTVASTPPPTVPTTPTVDPFDYEKSMYKDRIDARDLSLLKEQIRMLKGLPATIDKEKLKHKINSTKSPKVPPRPTFTSRKRKELQQHRMLVRCANMKDQYREFERDQSQDEEAEEKFRELRTEAMSKTNEQVDHEFEQEELENLKILAARAKQHEVRTFKETNGSKLRYRYNRGQPIISANFRNAYDDYFKPPFCLCKDFFKPKIYQLPKIDKKKEAWMVPVDDEFGIPLHYQPKSPDPADKRNKREKERPPVKPGKRTPMSEWKEIKNQGTTKRPAWGAYFGCPMNVGLLQ